MFSLCESSLREASRRELVNEGAAAPAEASPMTPLIKQWEVFAHK